MAEHAFTSLEELPRILGGYLMSAIRQQAPGATVVNGTWEIRPPDPFLDPADLGYTGEAPHVVVLRVTVARDGTTQRLGAGFPMSRGVVEEIQKAAGEVVP